MTELTVSMPAYNTGRYIDKAIESVLKQEGVNFELIVVDDGSEDDTAKVVQSFCNPKVRLIRNQKNMGIAYCHNMVIERSSSPFIAHVDSDDLVLSGAFQKMIGMLKTSSRIGQVHCNYLVADEDGTIIRNSSQKTDMDYRRELLVRGGVMNHLRTYRREVFQVVGKFNEKLRYSIDTEMALRVIDRYDIRLVPEYLYCRRRHSRNTSQSMSLKELRFWFQRLLFCRRLLKSDRIQFLKQKDYNFNRLMIEGLYHAFCLTALRILPQIFNYYNHKKWS